MSEACSNELGKQEESLNSVSRGEVAGVESEPAGAIWCGSSGTISLPATYLATESLKRLVEAARAYKVARDDLEQARASRTAAHPQQMVAKFDAFMTAQDAVVAAALALDEAGGV